MRNIICILLVLLTAAGVVSAQDSPLVPKVDRPVYFDVSPPLCDILPAAIDISTSSWKDGEVKNIFDFDRDKDNDPARNLQADAALQDHFGSLLSDTTIRNFDGMGAAGWVPPDTHGDVGYHHYFQVINCSYSIYNKSGAKILGPVASSSVWAGMPNNSNDGDAIVLYDEQSNRWLFSQFSLPNGSSTAPFYQMIAVSQTPDPTGSWYRYVYEFDAMPDYPKFGVWPDGYYMSSNNYGGPGGLDNGAYAYDRTAMLAGNPEAQRISFTLNNANEGYPSLLPADCDGTFPPYGTPNYFTYINTAGGQRLGIYEFHADWSTPLNSTFENLSYLNVAPFSPLGWGNGIPQKDSPQFLETLGDRLMYRAQFRQFNGYASMVLNHSVNAGSGKGGVRWYELRNTGATWSIYQQATYAPDQHSRWMGSIAQDTAGTIALGYSVSSASMYPAIRYTGRFKTDPLNEMTMMEKTIVHGGGSQTGNFSGRSRWGDYSAMSIDPSNPTTFWFTSEYYASTSSSDFKTRIASFTFSNVFSSSASVKPGITCGVNVDSAQLHADVYGGSGTYSYSWTSIPSGFTSGLQNPKVKPQQTTTYVVAVSDGTSTRHDTTELRIVEPPTAFAGNDTTVCWFVTPIPVNATATNYQRFLLGTTGDGKFTNPGSLITDYIPGIYDKTKGSVDLKLIVWPHAPCMQKATSIKHIILDPCTGMQEAARAEPVLNIQPNPAHESVLVTITGLKRPGVLTVTGMEGRVIFSCIVEPSGKYTVSKQLDVSSCSKGMFLLKLQSEEKSSVTRFIVQ
jgi:hypothetical protein